MRLFCLWIDLLLLLAKKAVKETEKEYGQKAFQFFDPQFENVDSSHSLGTSRQNSFLRKLQQSISCPLWEVRIRIILLGLGFLC